tara:strand:+ start:667 stop:792 length:126 start_codon:yes stop_codon:yes gene_type:complete
MSGDERERERRELKVAIITSWVPGNKAKPGVKFNSKRRRRD